MPRREVRTDVPDPYPPPRCLVERIVLLPRGVWGAMPPPRRNHRRPPWRDAPRFPERRGRPLRRVIARAHRLEGATRVTPGDGGREIQRDARELQRVEGMDDRWRRRRRRRCQRQRSPEPVPVLEVRVPPAAGGVRAVQEVPGPVNLGPPVLEFGIREIHIVVVVVVASSSHISIRATITTTPLMMRRFLFRCR